jgi:hypothetical protein
MKGRTLADQNKGSKGKVKMMGGRMVPGMMSRAMAPAAPPVMADRMGRAMKGGGMSYKKGGSMYRKGGSTCK